MNRLFSIIILVVISLSIAFAISIIHSSFVRSFVWKGTDLLVYSLLLFLKVCQCSVTKSRMESHAASTVTLCKTAILLIYVTCVQANSPQGNYYTVNFLLTDTSLSRHVELVPAVLQSFTSSPFKADTPLRRTVRAGPERVRLRGSWLYYFKYFAFAFAITGHEKISTGFPNSGRTNKLVSHILPRR